MGKTRQQIFRFALIGAATTSVHVCIAVILIELIKMPYLWANFFAFTTALLLSFFGHYHWTFSANAGYIYSFPRFAATAITGLSVVKARVGEVVIEVGEEQYEAEQHYVAGVKHE